jgi:hypothetical protein
MTHPWLADLDQTVRSDASPRETGVVELADGSLQHVPAPGSLPDQLGLDHQALTTARTSGSAATRDAQAYNSYGAAHEGPKELTRVRNAQ